MRDPQGCRRIQFTLCDAVLDLLPMLPLAGIIPAPDASRRQPGSRGCADPDDRITECDGFGSLAPIASDR
jgi:hypothetical protein